MVQGWGADHHQPQGVSRNGGAEMEFILPESIVLTALGSPTMAPQLGYFKDVGVEEDKNKADPREWPEHWYEGTSPAGIPMARAWVDCHLRGSVPASLEGNANRGKAADGLANGRPLTE